MARQFAVGKVLIIVKNKIDFKIVYWLKVHSSILRIASIAAVFFGSSSPLPTTKCLLSVRNDPLLPGSITNNLTTFLTMMLNGAKGQASWLQEYGVRRVNRRHNRMMSLPVSPDPGRHEAVRCCLESGFVLPDSGFSYRYLWRQLGWHTGKSRVILTLPESTSSTFLFLRGAQRLIT